MKEATTHKTKLSPWLIAHWGAFVVFSLLWLAMTGASTDSMAPQRLRFAYV